MLEFIVLAHKAFACRTCTGMPVSQRTFEAVGEYIVTVHVEPVLPVKKRLLLENLAANSRMAPRAGYTAQVNVDKGNSRQECWP